MGNSKSKKAKKELSYEEASKPSERINTRVGVLLKQVPLFSTLTDDECARLGGLVTERTYRDKQAIIIQGEKGDAFFIINEGEVVLSQINDRKERVDLGKLKKGDFFGEGALVNNAPRTATISACGDVSLWILSKDDFHKLIGKGRTNIHFAKRRAVAAENAIPTRSTAPLNAVRDKSPEVRQLILTAISQNALFAEVDPDQVEKIVDEMYRIEMKAGVSATKQGDPGDNVYVVEDGDFAVFVNGKHVTSRSKGSLFGELALLYNEPRRATVTATVDSVVWAIDRFTFRRIVTGLRQEKLHQFVGFLKSVPLLSPLAEFEREKIAEALEEVTMKRGTQIMKQGEDGDCMYLITAGEVVFYKDEQGQQVEVGRSQSGEFFGERALMTNEARAATAMAESDVHLLRLDRQAFHLLLGPLEDYLRKQVEGYEEKTKIALSRPVTLQPTVAFADLKVLGTLGKGSFGHVCLVQDKHTGKTYALKAVSKAQIVQTGQQGHIMSEKRAMMTIDHPFCVKLHATYKDKNFLYFLLEPSLGGELFSVLREKTLFDEDTARFYAAHVVLIFEYMHERNLVYRDLKPENLLLDAEGFIKMTDFGFAKDIGSSGRTWTLCGTPDYLAPEIVAGKGHGKGVDWWTLGVFIFEMLASYPPFYDEDPMKTYAKIMHGAVNFPSHMSKEAVSIIKKLLNHKPTKRLGVVAGGAALIKKHPWFKGFDWEGLLQRKLKPSIVPKVKSPTDMSNFDDYRGMELEAEPYVDDGTEWDREF